MRDKAARRMKTDPFTRYVIREEVMKLLSAEELAAIGTVDGANRLREGQEYLDLEQAFLGVRRASSSASPLGQVLPRDAVEAATWSKILTLVGQRVVP
jgi:hypothetical protein